MARIRSIKPEFFIDEDLAQLDPLDRLAYIGLWCCADKAGRMEDRPARLAVQILPYEMKGFAERISRLTEHGFIVRYQGSDGGSYIQIRSWDKHQRPHHTEQPSSIPPYHAKKTAKAPFDNGVNTVEERSGREGEGKGGGKEGKGGGKEGKGEKKNSPPLPPLPPVGGQRSRFSAPTSEEVQAYLDELGERRFTGQDFVDHYSSQGWVKSNGKKVVDWHGCVGTWRRSRDKDGEENPAPPSVPARNIPAEFDAWVEAKYPDLKARIARGGFKVLKAEFDAECGMPS